MKAAHWLGIGTESVRLIKSNQCGQMVIDELVTVLSNDISDNRVPIMVNGTAGTTVLGAIDNLDEIADVCEKYGVWMHVDVRRLISIQVVCHSLSNIDQVIRRKG